MTMFHDPVNTACFIVFILLNIVAFIVIAAWSKEHEAELKALKKKEKKK